MRTINSAVPFTIYYTASTVMMTNWEVNPIMAVITACMTTIIVLNSDRKVMRTVITLKIIFSYTSPHVIWPNQMRSAFAHSGRKLSFICALMTTTAQSELENHPYRIIDVEVFRAKQLNLYLQELHLHLWSWCSVRLTSRPFSSAW